MSEHQETCNTDLAQSLPVGPDGHSSLASKGPGSKLTSTVGG